MSERVEVTLGEVAEVTVGHVGPMASEYVDQGVPFLRSLNVRPHRIDPTELKYVDPSFHATLRKSALRAGDVVTVRTGKPGQTAVIPEWLGEANCADLVITRPGPCLDANWLSYYMNWITDTHIAGHLVGAVQQHFNVRSAQSLVLALPAIEEQQAIAEVLGALDDKIAANRRAVDNADELVRARYQAISGDSVLLGSIATNVRDLVNPETVLPETPYVGLEHVPRRSMWLSDFDAAAKATSAKAAFRRGDVLFGKLRPYFHKVVSAPFAGIASTDILVLRAKRPELAGLVLAAASSDGAIAATTASSEGTRMPRTKWADLAAVEIPWPGDEEARRFGRDLSELADWAGAAVNESRSLVATRDGLLPLLMSGQVRVKDAEKSVEGVL